MDENGIWAIVDLMGHIRLAGLVYEVELFGTPMGRVDIPRQDGEFETRFFSPQAVFMIYPVAEEMARAQARQTQPVVVYAARPERLLSDRGDDYDEWP